MSTKEVVLKRMFDFLVSLVALVLFLPIIILCWVLATIDTRSNGFFIQQRVGKNGKLFRVFKIKTMSNAGDKRRSSISLSNMNEITRLGACFRKYKLDELPQLYNVLIGDMSFVGPRPDVPGYADSLIGDDRIILSIRPGITGPASIKYKNEEYILAKKKDPKKYNDNVIWPDKVKLNKQYITNYSFIMDLHYILKTIKG